MVKEYAKRCTFCILSLALYACGCFLGVKAGVAGTNAWNTLSLGLAEALGISFGTGTFLISLLIIVVDLIAKGKLGVGTFLNIILIPTFSDLLIKAFAFIPDAQNPWIGAIFSLLGQIVIAFATVLYTSTGLGCGPRDTLMLIIGRKLSKIPIGVVKFCIEITVLTIGFLLGTSVGIGTVLVLLLQASIFQLACKITHYEPRSVQHEDIMDTLRRIRNK